MDTMTAEYWSISAVLTTDCRQNDLHLYYTKAVKFDGLWFVEKDMMADRKKRESRIELNVNQKLSQIRVYDIHIHAY